MPVSPKDERRQLIDEILDGQLELASLKSAEKKSRDRISRTTRLSNRALLYFFLGPRLTKRLGNLLYAAKEKNEPILGTSFAKVLDSASRKITGYKRWAVMFGLIAAIPGLISMTLLWQQNGVIKRETENTLADIANRARLDLLVTIYSSEEKDPEGALMTPSYAASLRSEAALELIAMDTASYQRAEKNLGERMLWRVDLSRAPLAKVNFSPSNAHTKRNLDKISFMASNMFRTSFQNCVLSDCWFDQATLIQTNFMGSKLIRCNFEGTSLTQVDFSSASIHDCNFEGAKYDTTTRWPVGFDPARAGAKQTDTNRKGESP